MTIYLPLDMESYIRDQVTSGLFASHDEAIAEAVRLLRRRQPGSSASKILTPEDVDRQSRGSASRSA